jgi:fido (protein-threonine AMPylation protein)
MNSRSNIEPGWLGARWVGTLTMATFRLRLELTAIADLSMLLSIPTGAIRMLAAIRKNTALRLHHRLVLVHLFPNGNGRNARLWANWLLIRSGEPSIDWGGSLANPSALRGAYVAALRAADGGDYSPLLELFGGPARI